MIGLDTNVLVRFLVEDDEIQAHRAKRLIAESVERGEPCLITETTLCETVWVLVSRYRFSRSQVQAVLEALLQTPHLRFRSRTLAERALARYQEGRGDFADYLISEQSVEAGGEVVATFDRDLHGEPGFLPL